ncbi:MAG: ferritin-like domain-containing protein [Acidobacteria bacterium]|nr:MAG: ferritin-like domain-containing protein [Acidobacteriota bacterium]
MSTVTLRDLYAAELHDLMNAEKQLAAELPIMAGRATSARLQRALEEHHAETKIQIERLRLLLEQLNEPPRAVPSGAVAALIEDARRRLDDAERGETLDAALIAAAQRIEHWEMATYGTARSYAEALGDYDAVRILQQTLDEEGHADHSRNRPAIARACALSARRMFRKRASTTFTCTIAPANISARSTASSSTASRAGRSTT